MSESEVRTHEFYTEYVAYTKIDCDIIDRIVSVYYGHRFEMASNGEWCSNAPHEFDVEPKVRDCMAKDAAKFRKDGKPRSLSNADVMNTLCADGWLEPGKYLVEVC